VLPIVKGEALPNRPISGLTLTFDPETRIRSLCGVTQDALAVFVENGIVGRLLKPGSGLVLN
jgi:hypothetical protein